MSNDVSRFLDTFLQESTEHLSTIESGLLKLKVSPNDSELLNSIFRAAHSIKGGAGVFGLSNVVRLTHALENLLDLMRTGLTAATPDSIAIMLQAADLLHVLTASPEAECPEDMEQTIAALDAFAAQSTDSPGETAISVNHAPETSVVPAETDYRILFRPNPDLFAIGCNPLLLLRNLSFAGTVLVTKLHTQTLPALADLDNLSLSFSMGTLGSNAKADPGTQRSIRIRRRTSAN